MVKQITVFGATGVQGGGVANELLKDKEWKVRGVTRDATSDKARKLADQGVEMVAADFDDQESLLRAFDGSHAVFVTTNFWEYISAHGAIKAGEREYEQGVRLAQVASKSSTLEHFIWSTLPSAEAATGGKHFVPHLEYKAKVDEYIKNELPDLAKKTTFLWVGFYTSNLAWFPLLKPTLLSTLGKYVFIQPAPASTVLPVAGDTPHNAGVFVRAILANPRLSLPARYASVTSEYLTVGECLKIWSKITGKEAVYVECTPESYDELWPVWGKEIALQFMWGRDCPDWRIPGMLTAEELGIEGQLVGFEKALGGLKSFLE